MLISNCKQQLVSNMSILTKQNIRIPLWNKKNTLLLFKTMKLPKKEFLIFIKITRHS